MPFNPNLFRVAMFLKRAAPDLSEQENFATAKLLTTSARGQFSFNGRAKINSPIELKIVF